MEFYAEKLEGMSWRYEVAPLGQTVLLLSAFGNVINKGTWAGSYGEHYKAWLPLPKRDKAIEEKLGFITRPKTQG